MEFRKWVSLESVTAPVTGHAIPIWQEPSTDPDVCSDQHSKLWPNGPHMTRRFIQCATASQIALPVPQIHSAAHRHS